MTTPGAARSGSTAGNGPGRMRNDADRPLVPGGAGLVAHELRVDDESSRVIENERGEREVGRPRLPQRRHPLVDHAVREQSSDDAVLALHEIEIARHGRDDRASCPRRGGGARSRGERRLPARDAVRRRSTRARPDCSRRGRARCPSRGEAASRPRRTTSTSHRSRSAGSEQRGVVGDPGLLGRHRAEVGDLHDEQPPDGAIPRDLARRSRSRHARARRPRRGGRAASRARRRSQRRPGRRRARSHAVRARPRAARPRRSSSARASRRGRPRAAPSRSPRPPARSRRRGTSRTGPRARPRRRGPRSERARRGRAREPAAPADRGPARRPRSRPRSEARAPQPR